jgi:hypothetical protein
MQDCEPVSRCQPYACMERVENMKIYMLYPNAKTETHFSNLIIKTAGVGKYNYEHTKYLLVKYLVCLNACMFKINAP